MYKTNVEEVGKWYAWLSTSHVGKKDRAWVELKDVPTIKTMMAEIYAMKSKERNLHSVTKKHLEKLGLESKGTVSMDINQIFNEVVVIKKAINNVAKTLQERGLL